MYMKTIEELEAQLTAISEQIKELKNKPKFEVGRWYKNKMDAVIFNDGKGGYGAGMCSWTNQYSDSEHPLFYNSLCLDWREATPEEVKAALVKEAEKRGFKKGNCYKTDSYSWRITSEPTFEYVDNSLRMYNDSVCLESGNSYTKETHNVIFDKGQWATIIKDDVIKVGSYEVKFHKAGSSGYDGTKSMVNHTSIDSNCFTKEFWQSAKLISEHSKAKIMVGCSRQFDVSLEVINKILDKL